MALNWSRPDYESLDWMPVESSNLVAVAYQADFQRLWVKFGAAKGSRETIYRYEGVRPGTFERLLNASSKGSFFNRNIRMSFPYTGPL